MSLSAWVVGMGGRTPVAMTRSGLALLARFTISLVNLYGFLLQLSWGGSSRLLQFSSDLGFCVPFFRNRRGRPRKHPLSNPRARPAVGGGEPCAAPCCCLPQEETVAWVQCDGCDIWFHVACVGCSIQAAREADFRCPGCCVGIQT